MILATLWMGWAALLGGASDAPQPTQAPDNSFAVRADELWLDSGQRVEDGVLWVEDGKVRAAGRGVELPQGTPVIEHHGVLTAGMIAFDSALGLEGEGREPKRAVHPEGRVADAFDASDEGVSEAMRQGITALVVTPSAASLVGGASAVIKTAHRTVLSRAAHLSLGLSDEAIDAGRAPTSKSGAMTELVERFDNPEGAFSEAVGGRLPVLVEVGERDDIRRALSLIERFGLRGVLSGSRRAGDLAAPLADSGLAVAVGPFRGTTPQRELASVVALGEAGVPLCFALDGPANHPARLRISAVMAVRAGLDPMVAWSGLTSGAASAAGVDERVGSLQKGFDADFVLWSGSPLDLQSRPVAVFIDGARVWQGETR